MTYSFEHRDYKGFAVEVDDNEGDGKTIYAGQVYGDSKSYYADTVEEVEVEFQRSVDERLHDGE